MDDQKAFGDHAEPEVSVRALGGRVRLETRFEEFTQFGDGRVSGLGLGLVWEIA